MAIRRISLHLDPSTLQDASALRAASGLAAALGARLWLLVYPSEPHDEPPSDMVMAEARKLAERAASEAGCDVDVVDRSSFAYGIGEVFADHLKVSDLGMMVGDPVLTSAQRLMLNKAVFAGGCPVLLWPRGRAWSGAPRRPVVGWDASPAASRALRASAPFAAQAEEAIVASVTTEDMARLEQSAVEATRYLAIHGARATFKTTPGRPSDALPALSELARTSGGDLLCVGAVRHAPIRDLILGGVTQEVFNRPPDLPLLLTA